MMEIEVSTVLIFWLRFITVFLCVISALAVGAFAYEWWLWRKDRND
jgi:hypothetical protein